ncbi:MAG: NADH-quinone oxidoreductase subunit L, partial [Gammaproteobacteria bacterium]
MLHLLWLVPALPLAGFLALAVSTGRLGRGAIAAIGTGSVGLAALAAIAIAIDFVLTVPAGAVYRQVLWTWIDVAGFTPRIGFYLD